MGLTRREFIIRSLLLQGSLLLWPGCARARKEAEEEGGEEPWRPAYMKLEEEGKLAERVEQAHAILERCQLCPRQCGVNRKAGERGFCRAPAEPMVYSAQPHFGEEVPLVGSGGSGTIFFSNCNLRCVFCQNWPIAHEGRGKQVTEEELAGTMLELQQIGCHNINVVTPTHVMPNILAATRIALKKGLRLPLVWNTSGYERLELVKLLDGIVDIYMPDVKYTDGERSAKYSSGARDYPERAKRAIVEMTRQVGELTTNAQEIALRGLMIRHLVMPNRVAGSKAFVGWVAEALPRSTYVNIMAQYRVEYKAFEHPELARAITLEEYLEAMDWAEEAGLTRLDSRSLARKALFRRRQ